MEDMDDVLTAASDAMFEGDQDGVVVLCQQALQMDPTEPEAFRLLALALMNLQRFEDAKLTALTWRELENGMDVQQLAVQLRSAYLAEDAVVCNETARDLLSAHRWANAQETDTLDISGPDRSLRFLATVLANDLLDDADPVVRMTLPALPELQEEDFTADAHPHDISSIVLRRWLECLDRNSDEGVQELERLVQLDSNQTLGGYDLALALTGVLYLRQQRVDDAKKLLGLATEHRLNMSPNVIALEALIAVELFTENPDGVQTPEKETEREHVRELLMQAQTAHVLLRRRVCRYLQ